MAEPDGPGVLRVARSPGDRLGLLDRPYFPPFIRGRDRAAVAAMSEGEIEKVRFAVFGVTSPAALGHANETQRFGLTDSGGDGGVMDSVVNEVLILERQLSVIVAAVIAELKFYPGNHPVRRQ
jgi:hypothetical protein